MRQLLLAAAAVVGLAATVNAEELLQKPAPDAPPITGSYYALRLNTTCTLTTMEIEQAQIARYLEHPDWAPREHFSPVIRRTKNPLECSEWMRGIVWQR